MSLGSICKQLRVAKASGVLCQSLPSEGKPDPTVPSKGRLGSSSGRQLGSLTHPSSDLGTLHPPLSCPALFACGKGIHLCLQNGFWTQLHLLPYHRPGPGSYLSLAAASRLSVGRPLEFPTPPALQGLPKAPLDLLPVVCPPVSCCHPSPSPVSLTCRRMPPIPGSLLPSLPSCRGRLSHSLTLLFSPPRNATLSKLSLHTPALFITTRQEMIHFLVYHLSFQPARLLCPL